jgi:small subunit ribosomal protein S20
LANTKSAQKAMRQTERRTAQNRSRRSAVRTFVKKAGIAVLGTSDNAAEVVRQAVKALDKAAKRGIIHPNAAARRKSRLMSQVHGLGSAASTSGATAEAAPSRGRTTRAAARTGTRKTTTTTARKPAASKSSTSGSTRSTTAKTPARRTTKQQS